MKMSLAQNKRLHGLLNLLGLMDEKKALVLYFSAKRTDSARELEPHQAAALIDHLAAEARARGLEASTAPAGPPAPVAAPVAPAAKRRGRPPGTGKPQAAKPAPTPEMAQKMRRKLFAIARALGWCSGDTAEDHAMNRAVMDKFLCEHGYLKKPLSQYTPAELPKLVTQFDMIQQNSKQADASRAVKGLLAETGLSVTTKRAPRS